jgi:hypothetical protein
VVDLLARHHADGRRFEPLELVERGRRVAVRLGDEAFGLYKVFTFAEDADELVLLEDCLDRGDALSKLC